LDVVVTGGGLTQLVGADAGRTVGGPEAAGVVGAGVAIAAAVHVGLIAVLEAVVAAGGHADPAHAVELAEAALAVGADEAALAHWAVAAVGSAAVVARLAAVLDAVVTGRSLADVVGADQALTVVAVSAAVAIGTGATATATVHVALVTVLDVVVTGRRGCALASQAETAGAVSVAAAGRSVPAGVAVGPTTVRV